MSARLEGKIEPDRVFDLTLPLEQVAKATARLRHCCGRNEPRATGV